MQMLANLTEEYLKTFKMNIFKFKLNNEFKYILTFEESPSSNLESLTKHCIGMVTFITYGVDLSVCLNQTNHF